MSNFSLLSCSIYYNKYKSRSGRWSSKAL